MTRTLIDPHALPCVRQLFDRLQSVYGQRILIAQQEFPVPGRYEQEMEHILRETGQLPAIRGMDFMHDDYAGTIARARDWHARGGLVSICWHTGLEGLGYQECLAESPDFDALFTPGTAENTLLLRRWDDAAAALATLQAEGIPVLWRPFHEFNGAWFWWGKGGAEVFVRLWRWMVDYFTKEKQLHNLIWVLGFSGEIQGDWYPGDAYCDIVGSDTYTLHTTHAEAFRLLRALCPGKLLTFHECGAMPEVDAFFEDGAPWLWMMPWHGEWCLEHNPPERLRQVYGHEKTLTLKDTKGWREH